MKKLPLGAASLAALLLATPAAAAPAEKPWRLNDALDVPPALKLSGSLRARYETISGQARAGLPGSEDLVNFRTILGAEYGTGPVRFHAELWDSRVYGGEAGGTVSNGESNALELVQFNVAVDLKRPLGEGTSGRLQAGRFMMDLGSRRLVAADDYRNTTNASTGARLELKGAGGWTTTVFYVLPGIRRPEDQPAQRRNHVVFDKESFDLSLWGGIAAKPIAGLGFIEASFIALDEKDSPRRPTRNRQLRTVGGRIMRNPAPGRFDYEIEGFHQFGSIRASAAANAARLDVSANFAHLETGYQFAGRWNPRLSAEYDYASGDKGGGAFNRFDSLYGQRRADFTPAGLFNTLTRTNLSTAGLRLEVQPNRRTDAHLTARTLRLPSATDAFSVSGVRDPTGRSGRNAGALIDGRIRYWLVQDSLRFEFDGVWLSKGRFLREAPNANRDKRDTAYLSFNLTAFF